MPGRKGKSEERRSDTLRRELVTMLEGIDDEEALAFLVRQARTIVHNTRVEQVNREMQRLGREAMELSAEPSRTARTERAGTAVRVEAKPGGRSFILEAGGQRKIFSLDEMRDLARMCQAAPSATAGASRLYSWFEQNRTDVLGDVGIRSPRETVLKGIFKEIRANFRTTKS